MTLFRLSLDQKDTFSTTSFSNTCKFCMYNNSEDEEMPWQRATKTITTTATTNSLYGGLGKRHPFILVSKHKDFALIIYIYKIRFPFK